MHVTNFSEWYITVDSSRTTAHEHHFPNATCFEAIEIETPLGNSASDSRVSGEERCKGGGLEEESVGRRGGKGDRSGERERRLSGNATVQRPDGRTWPLIVNVYRPFP